MNFFKIFLTLLFLVFSSASFADNHGETENQAVNEIAQEIQEDEDVPLNDPFAGNEGTGGSLDASIPVEEQEDVMSLYNFKLAGLISGKDNSYISLVNTGGEVLTLTLGQFLGKIKSCNALWCEPVSSEICAFQHLDKNTKEKKDDENDEETKIVPSLDIDLTDSHVRQVEIGIIAYVRTLLGSEYRKNHSIIYFTHTQTHTHSYVLRSGICRSLNLSRNRIGMDVLIPLLHELRFCDSLQVLDLSWNAIDHRCVKALCEVLIPRDRSEREIREETLVEEQSMTIPLYAYNKTLRSLSLAGNRVGYLGAISLNRVLKTHQCLCELNLFHSNLDAAGGKEISKSLRLNTVLRKLNLRFNNITQEGAKAIASALSENTTLKDLNLADNHFGRLGVMKLYHGLKKSRSFLDIARTIGYIPDTKIRVRGVSETQGK